MQVSKDLVDRIYKEKYLTDPCDDGQGFTFTATLLLSTNLVSSTVGHDALHLFQILFSNNYFIINPIIVI